MESLPSLPLPRFRAGPPGESATPRFCPGRDRAGGTKSVADGRSGVNRCAGLVCAQGTALGLGVRLPPRDRLPRPRPSQFPQATTLPGPVATMAEEQQPQVELFVKVRTSPLQATLGMPGRRFSLFTTSSLNPLNPFFLP